MNRCDSEVWMSVDAGTTRDNVISGDGDTVLSSGLRPDVLAGAENVRRRAALAAALFGPDADAALVGRYRLLHRVGEGAMGLVYAAYDERLDRKVAVKLIRPGRQHSEEVHRRTLLEARALARLSHPNVVHVYEAGELAGQIFVAMEFLAGPTLRAWLDERPRGWPEVLPVLRQAGEGLAAAHARGIVHRDFKPQNTIFGADGRLRVLDFGLARLGDAPEAAADGEAGAPGGQVATRAGAILGTPAYMAPEQFAERPADARSDQFSYCVVLFEALYGERPFSGASLAALAQAVTDGRIERPAARRIPEWIDRVIVRGLAVDPARRWPSMAELLAALGDDPSRRRRLRRRVLAGAAAVTVVAAATTWGLLRARTAELAAERDQHAEAAAQAREAAAQAHEAAARAREAVALTQARTVLDADPRRTLQALAQLELVDPVHVRRAWTIATAAASHGVPERVRSGPAVAIRSLALASASGRVFALDNAGSLWRWDAERGAGEAIARLAGAPWHVETTADGDSWVALSADQVEAGDASGARRWHHPLAGPTTESFIAADGRWLVEYEGGGAAPRARDLRDGAEVAEAFPGLAWPGAGRQLVAADARTVVWARPGAEGLRVWTRDDGGTREVAAPLPFVGFSRLHGRHAVASFDRGGASVTGVWDVEAGAVGLLDGGGALLGPLGADAVASWSTGADGAVASVHDLTTLAPLWQAELGEQRFFNATALASADGASFAIRLGDRRRGRARTILGDARTGAVQREVLHPDPFNDAVFAANGELLVASGARVEAWAASSRAHAIEDLSPGRAATAALTKLSPRGRFGLRFDETGVQRISRGSAATPLAPCPVGERRSARRFDDSGRVLQAGADQACLYAADAAAPRIVAGPGAALRGLALAPDGVGLALDDVAGQALVWSSVDAPPRTVTTGAGAQAELEFSPDGRWLVSATAGGGVRLHDAATSRELVAADAAAASTSVDFAADGRTLAVLRCADPWLYVHSLVDGATVRHRLARAPDCGLAPRVRVSADGARVAMLDDVGLAVWDLPAGERRAFDVPITGHTFAFTADGQALVGGFLGGVGLIDLVSGEAVTLVAAGPTPPAVAVDGDAWVAAVDDAIHRWAAAEVPNTAAGLRAWLRARV